MTGQPAVLASIIRRCPSPSAHWQLSNVFESESVGGDTSNTGELCRSLVPTQISSAFSRYAVFVLTHELSVDFALKSRPQSLAPHRRCAAPSYWPWTLGHFGQFSESRRRQWSLPSSFDSRTHQQVWSCTQRMDDGGLAEHRDHSASTEFDENLFVSRPTPGEVYPLLCSRRLGRRVSFTVEITTRTSGFLVDDHPQVHAFPHAPILNRYRMRTCTFYVSFMHPWLVLTDGTFQTCAHQQVIPQIPYQS